MDKFSNIRDAVLWAASFLAEKGVDNGHLEAELLMALSLGCDRAHVLASLGEGLNGKEQEEYVRLVFRRGTRYPLQYLTGKQEFMSLPFFVGEGVLIPRGDTEVLVEAILDLGISFKNILDVGTGSGIIALSLANYIENSRVTAVDVSPKALEIAGKNARALGLEDRVNLIKADVFEWTPEGKYDLVVSNPPYIPPEDMPILEPEVKFEPAEALDGGNEGLTFYFRLAELGGDVLLPGGVLAVETGWNQGARVKEIMEARGFEECAVIPDHGGRDRVVMCRKG